MPKFSPAFFFIFASSFFPAILAGASRRIEGPNPQEGEKDFNFGGQIWPNDQQWKFEVKCARNCHPNMQIIRSITRTNGPLAGTFSLPIVPDTHKNGDAKKIQKLIVKLESLEKLAGQIRTYIWIIRIPSFKIVYHFHFGHFLSLSQGPNPFLRIQFTQPMPPARLEYSYFIYAKINDVKLGHKKLDKVEEWEAKSGFDLGLDKGEMERHLQRQARPSIQLEMIEIPNALCQICNQFIPKKGATIKKLEQCDHIYHKKCINKWLNERINYNGGGIPRNCPECETELRNHPERHNPRMKRAVVMDSTSNVGEQKESEGNGTNEQQPIEKGRRGHRRTKTEGEIVPEQRHQAQNEAASATHSSPPHDPHHWQTASEIPPPVPNPTNEASAHLGAEDAHHFHHLGPQLRTKTYSKMLSLRRPKQVVYFDPNAENAAPKKCFEVELELPILQNGNEPIYAYFLNPLEKKSTFGQVFKKMKIVHNFAVESTSNGATGMTTVVARTTGTTGTQSHGNGAAADNDGEGDLDDELEFYNSLKPGERREYPGPGWRNNNGTASGRGGQTQQRSVGAGNSGASGNSNPGNGPASQPTAATGGGGPSHGVIGGRTSNYATEDELSAFLENPEQFFGIENANDDAPEVVELLGNLHDDDGLPEKYREDVMNNEHFQALLDNNGFGNHEGKMMEKFTGDYVANEAELNNLVKNNAFGGIHPGWEHEAVDDAHLDALLESNAFGGESVSKAAASSDLKGKKPIQSEGDLHGVPDKFLNDAVPDEHLDEVLKGLHTSPVRSPEYRGPEKHGGGNVEYLNSDDEEFKAFVKSTKNGREEGHHQMGHSEIYTKNHISDDEDYAAFVRSTAFKGGNGGHHPHQRKWNFEEGSTSKTKDEISEEHQMVGANETGKVATKNVKFVENTKQNVVDNFKNKFVHKVGHNEEENEEEEEEEIPLKRKSQKQHKNMEINEPMRPALEIEEELKPVKTMKAKSFNGKSELEMEKPNVVENFKKFVKQLEPSGQQWNNQNVEPKKRNKMFFNHSDSDNENEKLEEENEKIKEQKMEEKKRNNMFFNHSDSENEKEKLEEENNLKMNINQQKKRNNMFFNHSDDEVEKLKEENEKMKEINANKVEKKPSKLDKAMEKETPLMQMVYKNLIKEDEKKEKQLKKKQNADHAEKLQKQSSKLREFAQKRLEASKATGERKNESKAYAKKNGKIVEKNIHEEIHSPKKLSNSKSGEEFKTAEEMESEEEKPKKAGKWKEKMEENEQKIRQKEGIPDLEEESDDEAKPKVPELKKLYNEEDRGHSDSGYSHYPVNPENYGLMDMWREFGRNDNEEEEKRKKEEEEEKHRREQIQAYAPDEHDDHLHPFGQHRYSEEQHGFWQSMTDLMNWHQKGNEEAERKRQQQEIEQMNKKQYFY